MIEPDLGREVEEPRALGGGKWQGSYSLGQPLILWEVRQPGTSFVVFPGGAAIACISSGTWPNAPVPPFFTRAIRRGLCVGYLWCGNEVMGGAGWLLLNQLRVRERQSAVLQMALCITCVRQTDEKASCSGYSRGVGDSVSATPSVRERTPGIGIRTRACWLYLRHSVKKENRDPLLFRALNEDYRLESWKSDCPPRPVAAGCPRGGKTIIGS